MIERQRNSDRKGESHILLPLPRERQEEEQLVIAPIKFWMERWHPTPPGPSMSIMGTCMTTSNKEPQISCVSRK